MLAEGTLICENNSRILGHLAIDGVDPEETVMNLECEFAEVKYVVRGVSEDLLTIKSNGGFPITLTSDHPLMTCERGGKPKYKEAKDLTCNDYLMLPINKWDVEDNEFNDNPHFWTFLGIFVGFHIVWGCEAYARFDEYISVTVDKPYFYLQPRLEESIRGLGLPYYCRHDNGEVVYFVGPESKNKPLTDKNREKFDRVRRAVLEFTEHVFNDELNWNILATPTTALGTFYQTYYDVVGVDYGNGGKVFEIFHRDHALIMTKIYNKLFHRDLRVTKEGRGGRDYRLFVDLDSSLSWYDGEHSCLWTRVTEVEKYHGKLKVFDLVLSGSNNYIAENLVVGNSYK